MSQKELKGNTGAKGFASMDEERKKDIASQGGRASAQGKKTSNRGFASMDKEKQREISSQGGRASQSAQTNRAGRNGEDAELNDGIRNESDAAAERNPTSPKDEDSLESSEKTQGFLAVSETEEDEDEGIGDGNLGRSKNAAGLGK